MKKIIIGVLVIIEIFSLYMMYQSNENKNNILNEINIKENKINKNIFAIYWDENSTGEYTEYTGDSWPNDGYTLDLNNTKCMSEKGFLKNTSIQTPEYTFNGGASGSLTCLNYYNDYGVSIFGGGATDIRLNISSIGNWDDFDSLKSRIMVAAGGGGAYSTEPNNPFETTEHHNVGGDGGTIEGNNGQKDTSEDVKIDYSGLKATQFSGGNANGSFGKGGQATLNFICSLNDGAGGGSGYYGGGGSQGTGGNSSAGGGGGSSYISGHEGCVAIKKESTEDEIQPKDGCTDGTEDINCSYHYSGKFFTETQMIAGNELMPTHNGEGTMEGNTGNGYAKITFIE